MKFVGAHVSAAGGVENAPINARDIGAKAFGLFLKNQRRWKAKPLTNKNITGFKKNLNNVGIAIDNVLPHASYLLNLGHPEKEGWQRSFDAFVDELVRCHQLGIKMLNFHPGATLKKISENKCIDNIARAINMAAEKVPDVVMVVENTAGQGSWVGYTFKHLRRIVDLVDDKKRVGICLDTCHLFAAGYDISTIEKSREVFDRFCNEVGVEYLKALHLNDSKSDLASRVDRHENLTKGKIGIDVFSFIMNNELFNNKPLILETPDEEMWKQEIKLLYSL